MQPQTPSPDAGAPAPSGPEGDPQVQIALGPVLDIYPEGLKPPAESPAPPESEAPEPEQATAPETESPVAGAAASPEQGETRGTRRRAAEDAYQRGVAEGRAALEREQTERQQQDSFRQTQREANERIERLFSDLASPDYATQDRARQAVLQLYSGNRQASALMQSTRQQILLEIVADFANLGKLDGLSEDDYQKLHASPSAADLVKQAIDIGKRARDEQLARLEAENQGLRGRLVGSRATPEAHNGQTTDLSNPVSIEEYLAMSPKEARKLSSAQIDALTNQLAAAAERNVRSF